MAQIIIALNKIPILLLAMAISLQFHPTSTRPLKPTTKMAPELHQPPPQPPPATTSISGDPSGASPNDFRPTAPGYSPGVGHPKAVSDHISHTIPRKVPESSIDDFRPTAPGYSPGVGHPKEAITSSTKDDFRPTQPGHSPGAGHYREVVVSTSSEFPADFRPTDPGYSPGVGHPKDDGFFSGTKDDYRPTQPGHSPGVGHKSL